jgi:hypothetical protein
MTTVLSKLGLTRDSWVWFWAKLSAIAALVASGAIDPLGIGAYLGLTLSPVAAHWVTAVAVAVLWLGGNYDASTLPGKAPTT